MDNPRQRQDPSSDADSTTRPTHPLRNGLSCVCGVVSACAASFRAIPGDLRALNCLQAAFVTVFGIAMVVFSFVDFNYFLNPDTFASPFKWVS